jgi:hypothetical protein
VFRAVPIIGALLLAGCATKSAAPPAEPEFVHYSYDFEGHIGRNAVSGTVHFEDVDPYRITYRMSSDYGNCFGELRRAGLHRVILRCDDLSFEFSRGGRVSKQAPATLVTTEPVQRRECAQWTVTETGQRVCAQWHTVIVDRRVSVRGTLRIHRIDPDGWTG